MLRTDFDEDTPTLQRVLNKISAITQRLDCLTLPSIEARISNIERCLGIVPIQQATCIPPGANCYWSPSNNNTLASQVNDINFRVNSISLVAEETRHAVEGLTGGIEEHVLKSADCLDKIEEDLQAVVPQITTQNEEHIRAVHETLSHSGTTLTTDSASISHNSTTSTRRSTGPIEQNISSPTRTLTRTSGPITIKF